MSVLKGEAKNKKIKGEAIAKQTGRAGPRLDQEQEEVTKSMCGRVHADVKFVCAGVCVCVKVCGTGMPGTGRGTGMPELGG